MPMIDSDKLKPTLEAWQASGVAVVRAVQAADAAFLRGDQVQADAFHQKAQDALQ